MSIDTLIADIDMQLHPAPAVPVVGQEPVAKKVQYGVLTFLRGYHDLPDGTLLYAHHAPALVHIDKLKEALEMARDAIENGPRWNDGEQAYNKIEEALNK